MTTTDENSKAKDSKGFVGSFFAGLRRKHTVGDERPAAHVDSEDRTNVYRDFILPIINDCERDDEFLLVTPSTFFGFYSVGAKTYEEVCDALKKAKEERGVRCRILIDVGDVLSAGAAEGLLTFLREGDELRDMSYNPANYFVLRYRRAGGGRFVELNSKQETVMRYFPVRLRQFIDAPLTGPDDLDSSEATTRRTQFESNWEKSSERVRDKINRYMPTFYLKRAFDFVQVTAFFAFFAMGSVFGTAVAVSIYEDLDLTWWVILAYVASALMIGALASAAGNVITRRVFGRD